MKNEEGSLVNYVKLYQITTLNSSNLNCESNELKNELSKPTPLNLRIE